MMVVTMQVDNSDVMDMVEGHQSGKSNAIPHMNQDATSKTVEKKPQPFYNSLPPSNPPSAGPYIGPPSSLPPSLISLK